jgi:hypothetical protein
MQVWDNKYRDHANPMGLWVLACVIQQGELGYPVVNENGEVCPYPFDPHGLVGAPMGQYHCPYCGAMIIAGGPHINYDPERMDAEEREMFGIPEDAKVVVKFNPFAFDIETNNEFIRRGYEPIIQTGVLP